MPRLPPGEGVGDGRPHLDPPGGGAPQLAVPRGAATEALGVRDPPPAAVRAATSAGGCVRGGGRGAAPRPGWRGRKMAAGIREKQTGKRLPAGGASRSGGCPSRSCGEGRRVGLTLRPGAPACFPPCRPPARPFLRRGPGAGCGRLRAASPPPGDSRPLSRLGSPGNGTAAFSLLVPRRPMGFCSVASAAAGPGQRGSGGLWPQLLPRGPGAAVVPLARPAAAGLGPGDVAAGAAVVWNSPPGEGLARAREVSGARRPWPWGAGHALPSFQLPFGPWVNRKYRLMLQK